MLKSARVADTTSAHHLIELWAVRYLPNLSRFPIQDGKFPASEVVNLASTSGRSQTAEKIRRVLHLSCELAGLETNTLFSYIPNIVNLAESRRLAQYVMQVYERMLEIYERQKSPSYFLKYMDSSSLFSKLALPSLMLPTILQFAEDMEPVLLNLQQQHLSSRNHRTIGFITTQFHFSTREILKQLTLGEQVLLIPYLQFVEEQVCIPWQRICAVAATISSHSPALETIKQFLPLSHEIAQAVYQQALRQCPEHRSRRGLLNHPGIMDSTLRDLTMFQAYLWLCVLEERMTAIEQELLPLCVAVFPSVGVEWRLVRQMLYWLEQEICTRANPNQLALLTPYLKGLMDIFAVPRTTTQVIV